MPQAVPMLAAYVVSGKLLALGAYTWAALAAGGIVSFGLTKIMGLDEMPGAPAPGVKGTVKGSVVPIPIIYGYRNVGGALAQMMTTSSKDVTVTVEDIEYNAEGRPQGGYNNVSQIDNKILNAVICWSEGEVESITVYLNDFASSHERWDGIVSVENYTGTDTQTASPGFLAELAKTYISTSAAKFWTTDHRLLGVAYSYIKLTYDSEWFIGGVPNFSAGVKGRKILDLRDSVVRWSDNPALIVYDYLTNTRFGVGIDSADIDTDSFIESANYCDQTILVPGVNLSQKRYRCNAMLNPDETLMGNLRLLLASCRGALIFTGGKYKLRIDKPEVASFALTEDNVTGGWSIMLEGVDTRYNKVTGQFPNLFKKHEDDFAIVESAEYRLTDGLPLEAKIDLQCVDDPYQASQICGIVLRQSRHSIECSVNCTIEGMQCEVFDVVSVTHSVPGWDNQLFRVMQISIESDDQVKLQLRQYADAVYDLDSQNAIDSPIPTNLPVPEVVAAPLIEWNPIVNNPGPTAAAPGYLPTWRISLLATAKDAFAEQYTIAYSQDPAYFGWSEQTFRVPNADQSEISVIDVPHAPVYLYMRARAVRDSGAVSPWVNFLPGGRLNLRLYVPGVQNYVDNVRAIGHQNGVQLRWDRYTDDLSVKTEIRRAGFTSGIFNPENAQLLAIVDGESYLDPAPLTVSAATAYLYWVGFKNVYMAIGTFPPPIYGRSGLREYADDAAAAADGLETGDLYKLSTGEVMTKL
jgi:hypothetical protein